MPTIASIRLIAAGDPVTKNKGRYLKAYDSVSAARADIAEYLHWYNTGRSHSSLSDATPEQAYLDWLLKLAAAAQNETSGAPRVAQYHHGQRRTFNPPEFHL